MKINITSNKLMFVLHTVIAIIMWMGFDRYVMFSYVILTLSTLGLSAIAYNGSFSLVEFNSNNWIHVFLHSIIIVPISLGVGYLLSSINKIYLNNSIGETTFSELYIWSSKVDIATLDFAPYIIPVLAILEIAIRPLIVRFNP